MEFDRSHIYDGFLTLERGVDSGRTPASLARNQAAFAVNTTFRGGYPKCRPGWIKQPLDFQGDIAAAFKDGRFQGATFYDGAKTSESCLLAGIGGRLYRIAPLSEFGTADITPAEVGSTLLPQRWFCQAEEYMICQDGQMRPIIFDGGGTRRLSRDDELPVGRAMAYAGGRVWVTLADGYRFMAGDLVYSNGETNAVLLTTENDFLNEGGHFAMPGNSGGITAMVPTSNLDSSLGQGPLLVIAPHLIASVQAPFDRTTWKDVNYPIVAVALHGYGGLSDRSAVTVNGDVWYRAEDGIRSFILARRDFGQWGNTPSSAEMNRVIDLDTRFMLDMSSAAVFDNRFLCTVSPFSVQGHGVAHRGLAVLDFDILSRMHGAEPPAWEGIWTGVNVLQLVTGRFAGRERAFAFVLNGAQQIELWELSRNYPFDYGEGGDTRIEWSVELKAMDFDTPFSQKALEYGEIWVDELSGKINVSAEWRPDEYPKWLEWHGGWDENAVRHQSMLSLLQRRATPRAQYRAKMKLPNPDYLPDDISDTDLRNFFTIQPRIQIVGRCRLRQFRVAGRHLQEFPVGQHRT
jgi:hypothetical protein